MSEWEKIEPKVNEAAEFLEIAGDFGDPMELFREALHNAFDWHATEFYISINVEDIAGNEKLVIELKDNGDGMTKERIVNNFWNLGNSASKNDKSKIGEKGHGTKIYLRSDKIIMRTSDGKKSYESICESAFKNLNSSKMHGPLVREAEEIYEKGTYIRLEGYNQNDMGQYTQDIIKDYLYWRTKIGSFECELEGREKPNFKVFLKALNVDEYEQLEFGHIFAKENTNVNKLFDEYQENAADYFVKKYIYQDRSLDARPDIKYDVVIYVEGDEAKKLYNPLLKNRKNAKKGSYKVADRYGIYLCKDFIPIQRVNEWITGFGTGSNSYVMLHGFINCQKLKLTANRGSVANTNLQIVNELKKDLQEILNEIDVDLYKNNINTLKKWQQEAKTIGQEVELFKKRKEIILNKKYFEINGRTFLEPRNEAELYGLFMSIYTLYPNKFNFEPLDYDESIGIDLVARNKSDNKIADCEYWYVELKYLLGSREFNHSFRNVRIIVCWGFSNNLKDGSRITSTADDKDREFHIGSSNGKNVYYLDSDDSSIRIQVISLKEFIEKELQIEIKAQE